MNTKLRIDLTQGILEVEGSETFVKGIYTDFKSHFITEATPPTEEKKTTRTRRSKTTTVKPKAPITTNKSLPTPQTTPPDPGYTMLKLTLGATKKRAGLIEFTDAKVPITNEERNLVFLYYLQQTLKLKEIRVDHIYTCYKHVKARVPVDIENSLTTTAKQHEWLEVNEIGIITITTKGIDYVENNLPIKK